MIEHFGGDFPVWLSPEQVRIVPVSEKTLDYARDLAGALRAAGARASIDEHNDKLGAKIRRSEMDKVPYTLVLGAKEAESRSVSVRSRARGDEGTSPFDQFLSRLTQEIRSKALSEKRRQP